MERYDVIIIGTGAGGGTLAHRLAPSGKRIVLLDRGHFLPREQDNWDPRAVFTEGKYTTDETWLDKDGQPFTPGQHYYVGGNTKFYGAALLRMRERDFGEVVHSAGVSPKWPLAYRDFEPYYSEAETLYQVHGRRGGDPTDPPASRDYPHPPLPHEPRVQEIHDRLTGLGLHPFALPLGLLRDTEDPEAGRCIRCPTCDGFPCLVHAKADADIICVRPALEFPNVTLRPGRKVTRLETDDGGRRVTRVRAEREGEVEEYAGDIVVVSCGAINSAALLLRSANERHPDGLANGSGVVGRHYMRHQNSALMAISRDRNPTTFQKTLGLNDFYFEAEDRDYPLGHIQMMGKSQGEMLRGEVPSWLPAPRRLLDGLARHAVDFWLTSEDLPRPENRVDVDREGRVSLHLHEPEENLEAHRRLTSKLKSLLTDLDCAPWLLPRKLYMGKRIPIAGVAHQCGTVRFGDDPATSALNLDCKAHELDNLYVVDGSFFVSSSAVNPALTIIANALRVGDHLLERLGA